MVPQGYETVGVIKKYSQMFKIFFQTYFLFRFERHAPMYMCVKRKRNFYINVVRKIQLGVRHECMRGLLPAEIFLKEQQIFYQNFKL